MEELFRRLKTSEKPPEGVEESFYALATEEVETGDVRRGVWGKALAETEADEPKSRAMYIRLRVKQLSGEYALFVDAQNQVEAHRRRELLAIENREAEAAKPELHAILPVDQGEDSLLILGLLFVGMVVLMIVWASTR